MNRIPVNSSNITSIWFDVENNLLEIEFHHGRIYQYSWVPLSEYNGLMSASSHGSYFAKNIKDFYPFF